MTKKAAAKVTEDRSPAESKTAAAAGSVGGAGGAGEAGALGQAVEAAMSRAIHEAAADGITDPNEIRERMLRARDAVLEG